MSIHSPSCETYLAELLTAPTGSVDHRLADFVGHVPESEARAFLLTVIADDHGTRAADIAHQIWRRAAEPEEQR